MLACIDTARLVALVDQTQITKVALWPGLTSPAPERGWIRTHSCGVTFFGFGLGELGFGLGLGELGFGLGLEELGLGLGVVVELGAGVVVAGVDEALDEDEDVVAEADVVGLDEALLLSGLTDLVDVADELADVIDDAEELASVAAGSCLAALFVAAESTVFFGMRGHADLMTD